MIGADSVNRGCHLPGRLKGKSGISRRRFLKTGLAAAAFCGAGFSCRKEPSLEQKIGQMIMRGFRGLSLGPADPVIRDIREHHLGGVVLFDYDVPSGKPVRNIASSDQVRGLIAALQEVSDSPLLVAVDYEGGRVSRLKETFGFPQTYSAQALGLQDPAYTGEQAAAMADVLADLGFNLNLAPVVDVNINPDSPAIGALERSFSGDPEAVAAHAAAFIEAHHNRNILCTLKHFPGHGSAAADSHKGLTDISETWSEKELAPYRTLIRKGLADAVMTAHVFHKGLDPAHPATLSKKIIGGLLRDKLGFNGVVLSDCMQMGAIVQEYGFEEAVLRAVRAGVDILVYANNSVYEEEVALRAIGTLLRLVKEGKISEARINASWRRILKLKSYLAG